MSTVFIRVDGLPEVRRMLDTYSARKMQNTLRRVVRAGAKPFQAGLKSEARSAHGGSDNVPLSFQKVPAAKVTTRGGAGRDVEAYVRPKSQLFNIFEPGAGSHTISPKGKPLRGAAGTGSWTQVGRKRPGAFLSFRPVRHPGFASRDIMPEAFQSKLPEAVDAVTRALFDAAYFDD